MSLDMSDKAVFQRAKEALLIDVQNACRRGCPSGEEHTPACESRSQAYFTKVTDLALRYNQA
ncbi:hypothetical protein KSX_79210 [Ktedonospora formicarum]|uniref:Uncharacterized protein n=1 Tax=Ktedonospora formicarum TaxID=2778364 RepID=A0A8J3ICH0_9CHLR|nr:hypothetical protein KSX_79210 [Ktedonospora formicarum]